MKKKFTLLIAAFALLITVFQPVRAWGQTTATADVTLSSGTYSTDHIVWSFADGNITIQQLKGTGSSAVNSNYIAAPRVYKGHYLSFVCSNGYAINSISIKCDGSYYGNSLTAGTTVSNNTVTSNTTDINATWTTTSGGTHVISSVGTAGLQEIYIQNVASAQNVQLRPTQISITYTYTASSATPTTVTIDDSGITNTDVYVSTAAGSLTATVTENTNVISGASVTWSSSNMSVATIDDDGEVTLVAAGSTTITASYAGVSGTYLSSSATYELTVTSSEPYVQPTTIEIIPNYTFWGKTGQFSGSTYDELSGSKDNVLLYWTRGTGSMYANTTAMRFYKDNTLVFTAPTGYDIKSIVIEGTLQSDLTFDPTGFNSSSQTWSGSSATVTMSRPSTGSSYATISKYTITIGAASSLPTPTVTIDDSNITNTDIYAGTDAGSLAASVTYNNEPVSGATVTWSGNADAVATINETTGAVTLVGAGSVTFTATFAGNANYNGATATYGMTVTNSDPNVPGTVNNPYSVADAIAAIEAQGTINNVYATGIVCTAPTELLSGGYLTYWISDDGTEATRLQVYRGKDINGNAFTSTDNIQVGATVVITGTLKKYNSTYEFDQNNQLVTYVAPVIAVEAPTFSPAAGTFASAQEVTISCETAGATIYYTTDGTDPTSGSTEYTGTLNVSTTTTFKAIAIKGSDESTVATATYHICSQANPYTVTQALAFYEYPANGIYVNGIVSTAPTQAPTSNGELTYYISVDGTATNQLQVYKGKGLEQAAFTAQNDIQVGDIVTIYGNVKIYNSTKEFDAGNYLVHFERPTATLYTVNFNLDGGTFVPNAVFTDDIIEVAAGTYELPSATKTGTNFAGWLLDGTTDIYAAGASFNVTADVSFTAQWSNALTGTIHFSSTAGTGNMNINASPKEGTDDLGNTWTVTTEGTTSFTPSNQYCQIGASSKPATSITFTTTLPTDVTITAFEAKFGGFSGTAGDVSLTVGTTEVATGSLNATTDVIVGGPVAAYGKVLTVTVTNIAKGVKAYYISYSYEMTTDPIINAPATVELPYDATSGQINYTIVNPVAGKSLGATTTASWISNIVVTDEKVSFTTTANDGTDDRVATFTLTYEGAADKTVTVTQAHFVADYATLPFAFDAGRADIENTVGLTQEGLDTDYGSSPKLKFNTTGDWVILKLNEAPTSLSYTLKGNSTSNDGGVFSVQTSADGVDYVDLAEYVTTTLNNKTFTYTHIDLNANVRYIKWIYTNKSNGNVALGNIHATTNYDIYGNLTLDHLNIPIGKVCTIYSGATLNIGINGLSNEGNATNLIIKDGGQLYTPSAVSGTVEKNITGYGNSTGKDGYYLVSAPANTMISPVDNTDAYHFDASYEGQEWRNIRQAMGPWHISANVAALYASKEDRTLSFNGYGYNGTNVINTDLPATNANINVSVNFNSGKTFEGWNLIGNPYTCKAYLVGNRDFYRMNAEGNAFVAATGAIDVCEGIFVETTSGETQVTFTTTAPDANAGNNSMIDISLSQVVNRGEQTLVDNARIRFSEGNAMRKFSLSDNTAKVYFTEGNQDYAVVRSEGRGEMPVNFKTNENGTYTLDFSMDNVEFNYLHLIDNLTGNNVDLLQTPSYTFEANTNDYTSRFKLVFSTNGNDDINASEQFAFINNGEIILSGINGNTTVQLFDVTGRMLSSTNGANRISTENVAAGVYMLRLINGSDVKTQKIIVK